MKKINFCKATTIILIINVILSIVDDVSFQTVFDDVCEFVQALLEYRFVEVADDGR